MVVFQLPEPDVRHALILISGWRQVGKTTALLHLREVAHACGLSTGGFLSVARMAEGEKVGIDLMDAASGSRMELATMGGEGPVRTGHYSFNPAALEAGLRHAHDGHTADVYFVDELGPLELMRHEGWASVIPLIRERGQGVTLVVVRPELVDVACEQLGVADRTACVMIDATNRLSAAETLAGWLQDWAKCAR